jgi:hypothetical protein
VIPRLLSDLKANLSGTESRIRSAIRNVGATIAVFALVGCRNAGSAQNREGPHVDRMQADNDHGFAVGAHVPLLRLNCGGQAAFTTGEPHQFQTITLATPGECSACLAHMSGLEVLAHAAELPTDDAIITWAPGLQGARDIAFARLGTTRRICPDVDGRLFRTLGVSHAPVTIAVRDGRVVYMHDRPLASAAARALFVRDLALLRIPR